jgi:hypothetical protein
MIVVGTYAFVHTASLARAWHNMSDMSQTRCCIVFAGSACIVAAGCWLLYRSRGHS